MNSLASRRLIGLPSWQLIRLMYDEHASSNISSHQFHVLQGNLSQRIGGYLDVYIVQPGKRWFRDHAPME